MRSETVRTTRPGRAGVDEGMALITVIMVMMLVSVLMVGFVAAVVADNKASGLDRDQTQAYAAAHAGLEKLTSDLSGLFMTNFSPTAAQINALSASEPAVPGFQYLEPDGTSGYNRVRTQFDPATPGTITHGPYQGFQGLITPYNITVTARSSGGAEVRMRRRLQTIAVPVFQFGMFSENDLSFHAGSDFNFGGRVHTNGNLYVAEGTNATLTFSDRITAVGEIIRTHLSNGWATSTAYTGTVNVPTTIMANPVNNIYRALARTEGSLVGTVGSAPNVGPPTWTDLSVGTYHSNIRNGLTGARRLDLPLVSQGAVPVDLIRRPAQNSNEDVAAPLIYQQRYFGQAALRILLSDTAADITNLPTVVTATAPVPLDGTATAAQLTVDATHPPIATSPGPLAAAFRAAATPRHGANDMTTDDDIPAFLKAPTHQGQRPPGRRCVVHGQDRHVVHRVSRRSRCSGQRVSRDRHGKLRRRHDRGLDDAHRRRRGQCGDRERRQHRRVRSWDLLGEYGRPSARVVHRKRHGDAVHRLHGDYGQHRQQYAHQHERAVERRNEPAQRVHQDREAGRQRQLERRDDRDPEPGDRIAEPGRHHLQRRRSQPECHHPAAAPQRQWGRRVQLHEQPQLERLLAQCAL